MLVVLAITVILMLILFIPLSRSIDLTQRGRARVDGMDSIRNAMRRVTVDLSNAMEVYEPRDIPLWGYSAWNTPANPRKPDTANLASEAYLVNNGLIAFRLPKHRYYCTRFSHSVTPVEISGANGVAPGAAYDYVALASCPRHTGAPLEFRPLSPLEPEDRITAYFVGLKDPSPRIGNRPAYRNLLLFGATGDPVLDRNDVNTYTLYRVEFNPNDPNFGNWNRPDFFYDTTAAPNGQPFWQNWYSVARSIINSETADVVRWRQVGGKLIPQSLCTFGPSPVVDEIAQPDRSSGSFLTGTALPDFVPPQEYVLPNGHWLGVQNDRGMVIPDALVMADTATAGIQRGPHIQVFDKFRVRQFDSVQPATRNRIVSYDSLTGRVNFAINRSDNASDAYSATLDATDPSEPFVDLKNDVATFTATLGGASSVAPTSFGAAYNDARFRPTIRIVAGSESVQLAGPNGEEPMRRAGWVIDSARPDLNRDFVEKPLAPYEYTVDYQTGVLKFGPQDPDGQNWANYRVLIRYKFQTNAPDDVVRVSYTTKDFATATLGVVQYTRKLREALPFEVTERVQIRNVRR